MKKTLLAAAVFALGLTNLYSPVLADLRHFEGKASPDQVARKVVGTWRYKVFFRVEYMAPDSSGVGRVTAPGRTGTYHPTKCGSGDRGNMIIRTEEEEICVTVQFVDGAQIVKFPPRGDSEGQEVHLYPERN